MNKRRQSGFTLLEVMVGMVCAGILAITIGALLYYNYQGWQRLQAVADMQRDASLAMNTMDRAIRGVSSSDIQCVGNSLTIGVATNFIRIGDQLRFTRNGASMDLVRTGVTGFTCTNNPATVVVTLSVTENSMSTSLSLTNTICPRN